MDFYRVSSNELMHYGIKGQKWGIRRFQNPDGTLTPEGRARARKEYKEDNKKAFELGKDATIKAYASGKANRIVTRRNGMLDAEVADRLDREYKDAQRTAEKHAEELVKKYGAEAIKPINYNKRGYIQERVSTGKDWVIGAIASGVLTTIGMGVVGPATGVGVIAAIGPASHVELGNRYYAQVRKQEKKKLKETTQ